MKSKMTDSSIAEGHKMIGGTDILIEAREGFAVWDMILRTVLHHWPDCVYQNANDASGTIHQVMNAGISNPPSCEVFIYRDATAAQLWEEEGATEETANTMLHVIVGESSSQVVPVTLVCDDLSGEMAAIVDEIQAACRDSLHQSGNENE